MIAIPTRVPAKVNVPAKASKISVDLHMVDIWVILSAVLRKGVLHQTEKHNLKSYIEFMVWLEASSWQGLAEADEIDKNLKLYSMPTDEMERLYLCNWGFKPPE